MLSENWFIFNILCDKLILSYMEMDFFLNKKKKKKRIVFGLKYMDLD
jgi:hypothetical protein